MLQIQPESQDAAVAVEALYDRAFGPDRHTKTSYSFRHGVAPVASLSRVALEAGDLVGAIRYWPVWIGQETPALLLGPLGIEPSRQGCGIGRRLMTETLAAARTEGHRIVLLVGDQRYYEPRGGFRPVAPFGITMDHEMPHRLLGIDLVPGALAGTSGPVRHWTSAMAGPPQPIAVVAGPPAQPALQADPLSEGPQTA